MIRHLETLKEILIDIRLPNPVFNYPENEAAKRAIKKALQETYLHLNGENYKFELALEGLYDSLEEKAGDSSSPRNPFRPASPLTFQLFKPISTSRNSSPAPDNTSPAFVEIKREITALIDNNHEMLKKSQKEFLMKYPLIKSIYILVFADKTVFDNQSTSYRTKAINTLIAGSSNNPDLELLKMNHTEMNEIRKTILRLKEDPEKNVDAIFSQTERYIEVIQEMNAEWDRIKKGAIRTNSSEMTIPPKDKDQPQDGRIQLK